MQVSVVEAHALYNKEARVRVSLGRFVAKRIRNIRKLSGVILQGVLLLYLLYEEEETVIGYEEWH
jgi:hypothetical protein